MKREHQDKMEDLFRREEEAKKQVQLFIFILFNLFFFLNKGCNLGTKVSRMDGNDGKTC